MDTGRGVNGEDGTATPLLSGFRMSACLSASPAPMRVGVTPEYTCARN